MLTKTWTVAILLCAVWPLSSLADPRWQAPPGTATALLRLGRQAIAPDRVLEGLTGLVLVGERRFITGLSAEPVRTGYELGLFPPDGFLQTFRPLAPMIGMTRVGGTSSFGFAGERHVSRLVNAAPGEGIRRLSGAEERQAVLGLQRRGTALLVSLLLSERTPIPIEYTYVGLAEAKDGSADILEARGAEGFALRLFLDSVTHRVLLMEPTVRLEVVGPKDAAERWRFSDYVRTSGLSLPRLISIDVNGTVGAEYEFGEVSVNPPRPRDLRTQEPR